MKMMIPLILIILGVSGVECDSHTLQYYTTGVSSPGSGLPVYSEVGYVDDREIANYNSDTRQCLPKTEWMKKVESDYWERETQKGQSNEALSKHNVQTVMSLFNQTGGIHIVQWMYGCELRDDGTTEGYYQFGYDGREFASLDTQRWIWIPTMNEAQISTQRWNSPEERWGERNKNYLKNECIEWLKKYINNGREELEKRDPPGNGLSLGVIIGAVIGIIILLAVVIAVVYWIKKNQAGYKSTNTSDNSKEVKA